MRVTRESLIRIAKETAQERAYNDRDIIAAYLTGSLVSNDIDPLLGGTTDIDIIFVHATEPKHRREFVKLTPDFHVDLGHRAKSEFKRPRELRLDPWLGWEMYDPQLLFEREKFFGFVQAGLRAGFEFNAPAPALQRSRALLAHGRQIWRDLLAIEDIVSPMDVVKYIKSLYHAVNAVAELSGPPLHERRLLLEFPSRAEAAQRPRQPSERRTEWSRVSRAIAGGPETAGGGLKNLPGTPLDPGSRRLVRARAFDVERFRGLLAGGEGNDVGAQ